LATIRGLLSGWQWRVGIVPVTYSSDQLATYSDAVMTDIQQNVHAFTNGVFGVEHTANKVVITVNAVDTAFNGRISAAVPAGAFVIRVDSTSTVDTASTPNQFTYGEHQGGMALDTSTGGTLYQRCTTGFTMIDNDSGNAVGLTAGHCAAH